MKPALVILAAGASERLGTCKALVELGRDAEGRRATPLALLLAAGGELDEVPPLVVAGKHAAEIAAALPPGVDCAVHPDWARGRTGGVALASSLRPGRDLCIAPVDVPRVPRAVFEALARAWADLGAPPRGWLAPTCAGPGGRTEGSFGHPVLVGRELLLELGDWPADRPLRDLRAQAVPLRSLAVEDPSVLDDLDTPSDLVRMRAKFAL